jgi:hypothetical protein
MWKKDSQSQPTYRKKLIMLEGQNGTSGFVNMEAQGGKTTLKFQAGGLAREDANVHGWLVSLAKKKRVDAGRLRVDSRGQGALLRSFDSFELDGLAIDDFETIVVTSGGIASLAGSLASRRVDWSALKSMYSDSHISSAAAAVKQNREFVLAQKAENPSRQNCGFAEGLVEQEKRKNDLLEQMQPNLSVAVEQERSAPIVEKAVVGETSSASQAEKWLDVLGAQGEEVERAVFDMLSKKYNAEASAPVSASTSQEIINKIDLVTEAIAEVEEGMREFQEVLSELADTRSPFFDAEIPAEANVAIWNTPAEEAETQDEVEAIDVLLDDILETAEPISAEAEEIIEIIEETVEASNPIEVTETTIEEAAPVSSSSAATDQPPPEAWPVWRKYHKPALEWPQGTDDLRELFETGTPDERIKMDGWLFVTTPSPTYEYESLLGVLTSEGAVSQSVLIITSDDGSAPPAGLVGYQYNHKLLGGCWTLWREYNC